MKYCEHCGKQLKDSAKFCPGCGTPIQDEEAPKTLRCPHCGEPLEAGAVFCDACGARLGEPSAPPAPKAEAQSPAQPVENAKETTEYLGRVVHLEQTVYALDRAIDQIQGKIQKMGHRLNFQKPVLPGEVELFYDCLDGFGTMIGAGAFVGGAIGLFTGGLLKGIIWGGVIMAIVHLVLTGATNSNTNRERQAQYAEEKKAYDNAVAADNARVEEEIRERTKLIALLDGMKEKRQETADLLELFYQQDLIYPKYRNLVAVCSFYEYFMSGRCFALAGANGAYNKFEEEARMERICTKLDVVVSRLEDIKANQYTLYDAIQEGNRMTHSLVEESYKQSQLAETTAQNAALTAQYAEITANNTEAAAWIGAATYLSLESGKSGGSV